MPVTLSFHVLLLHPQMKALVLFFLFLGIYLFGGYNSADASFYSKAYFSVTPKFNKSHIELNQGHTLLKPYGEQEEKFDLVNDEDDDDLTRKLVSLAKYFSAFFCYVFILSYVSGCPPDRFSFYHLFPISSRKYIAQRVLRI
jgi:hypothetical protein